MKRINVDQFDFVDGDPYVSYYQGQPFTGVGYELRPNGSGRLWSEETYTLGVLDGPSRDWHDNGQMKSETYYKFGLVHGLDRQWYPDGKLQSEVLYELNTALERRSWNEAGALTEEWHIDVNSREFQRLKQLRLAEDDRERRVRKKLGGTTDPAPLQSEVSP